MVSLSLPRSCCGAPKVTSDYDAPFTIVPFCADAACGYGTAIKILTGNITIEHEIIKTQICNRRSRRTRRNLTAARCRLAYITYYVYVSRLSPPDDERHSTETIRCNAETHYLDTAEHKTYNAARLLTFIVQSCNRVMCVCVVFIRSRRRGARKLDGTRRPFCAILVLRHQNQTLDLGCCACATHNHNNYVAQHFGACKNAQHGARRDTAHYYYYTHKHTHHKGV